jgi:hypothetical protein
VGAEAQLAAQVNIEKGEWFEVTRVAKGACVNRIETETGNHLANALFGFRVITRKKDADGSPIDLWGLAFVDFGEHGVESLYYMGTGKRLRDHFGA